MENWKEMENLLGMEEIFNMMGNGLMINLMGREYKNIRTVRCTQGSSFVGKRMTTMLPINGQMERYMLDHLKMDLWKGMVIYTCKMVKDSMLDNFPEILKLAMEK